MHITSMDQCKKDVTPLLTHWSYVFLALTHRLVLPNIAQFENPWKSAYDIAYEQSFSF